MRKIHTISLSLLMLLTIAFLSCKDSNKKHQSPLIIKTDTTVRRNFVSSKYNFRIWFPKKPQQLQDTMIIDSLTITYTTFLVDMQDSFFMLTAVNYPKAVVEVQKPSQILLNGHHKAIFTQNLTADYEHLDTTTHSYPILYYKVHNDQFKMVGMNLFRDSTMFQLFLVNVKSYPSQQTINRFLGSFQLLDKN